MRTDLGTGHSRLGPPRVVGEGIVFPPIAGFLSPVSDIQIAVLRRGRPLSRLRPPRVVAPAAAFIAAPIKVELAPSTRLARATHPRLRPPVVIDLRPQVYYLNTSLAYSRRGVPKSLLRSPTDTIGLEDQGKIRVTLTPSPRQARAPHASLRSPVVVDLTPQTKYLAVQLTYSRRGVPKSRLEPPTVVATFVARPGQTHLAYSVRGRTMSVVRAPRVVGTAITFAPVAVHLAASRRGTAKSRLTPPTVVTVVAVAYPGPRVGLAKPIPERLVGSFYIYPIVVTPAVAAVYYAAKPTFVRFRTVKTNARLFPPTVVGEGIVFQPIQGYLVPLNYGARPVTKSRLEPPTVVTIVVVVVFYGPSVTLAYQSRGQTGSRLFPPTVIDNSPQVFYLTISLAYSRRGVPKSRLQPPTVVDIKVYYGPQTSLAYSRRGQAFYALRSPVVIDLTPQAFYLSVALTRIRPPAVHSRLSPSTVTEPLPRAERDLRTTLAYSVRGVPKSELRPPTVIDTRPQVFYPAVTLAASRRGVAKPRLLPPAVVSRDTFFGPAATLTPSRRPKARYGLAAPAVVFIPEPVLYPVSITLAPSHRGVILSRLRPPAVVAIPAPFIASPVTVWLAPSRRLKARYGLAAPAVVFIAEPVLYPVAVTLAYSIRGKPKSTLRRPPVVGSVVYYGPAVSLAYSLRGTPRSKLRAPVVIDLRPQVYYLSVTLVRITPPPVLSVLRPSTVTEALPQAERDVRVTLAYSRRGVPESKLRAPVVIDVRPQTKYLAVHLTYSRRGKARYGLAAPAVVFAVPPAVTQLLVRLAYSVRKPGEAKLRAPVVVSPIFARAIAVHLAYSRRGEPFSILRKPTVIDLRPQVYYLNVSLTRITPPPTMSRLSPSTVTEALPKAERDLRITLAYSLRGRPKSRLRPPTVIDLRPQTRFLSINLTYSRRGKPTFELRAPAVVAQRPLPPIRVELAYQSRKRGRTLLRPPAVVAPVLARPLEITLTKQYRPSITTFLRPPTVVVPLQNIPTVVTLVRNKPQPTTILLRPPTRVFPFVARPVEITLTRISPPERFWRLSPPTVVAGAVLYPLSVTFAYQTRGKPKYGLAPPAIVAIPEPVLHPIKVALVRITPPERFWKLLPPAVVRTFIPPAGDVCGFDEEGSVVTGMTESGSTIQGSDEAGGGEVCGDDQQST